MGKLLKIRTNRPYRRACTIVPRISMIMSYNTFYNDYVLYGHTPKHACLYAQ